MQRKTKIFLSVILIVSLIGCTQQNQSAANGERPSNNTVQNDQPNNDTIVLDNMKIGAINLARHILKQTIDLEGMEKEYGPIVEVDWFEGAFYRHEGLDLWIAYYFQEGFVVSFPDDAYIERTLGEAAAYHIDYSAGGPYIILEEAKKAPILCAKCELSDLFDEIDDLTIEDFAPFSEIFYAEVYGGADIIFNYEDIIISIMSADDYSLDSDCLV